jgi:hypothetical protein
MEPPIRFRSDCDVIAEEAARYRALSPDERFRYLQGILATGGWMIQQSPHSEAIREARQEQEELAMRAVKEFIARHAR